MSLFMTLPITAGLGVMIKGASDLEESVNKVNVVFGESAESIHDWSEDSATAFGLSRQEAEEAAGTFGNLFKTMGTGQEESAEMSESIVELSADLASFHNIPIAEALEKLRSGLVGEAEPMRALGVLLSEGEVKAEAYRMGIANTGEELTEQQKVQARYSLILGQTNDAQGDFARTSDGLANSTRIASAQLKDMAAKIGADLIPMAKDALGIIKPLLDAFSSMPAPLRKVGIGFALMLAAAGPLLVVTGSLMKVYGGLITTAPKIVSTTGNLAKGFRDASAAQSAASGTAGTLGGKLRTVTDRIRTTNTGLGKQPNLFNTAAGSAAAYAGAIAGITVALVIAIDKFNEMRDAQAQAEQARKDAQANEEAALARIKAKYGENSEQYRKMTEAVAESNRILADSYKGQLQGVAGYIQSIGDGIKESWWLGGLFKTVVGSAFQGGAQIADWAGFGGAQASGGDYLVTKPTMFLAGEAGPERATFTPQGKAGPGGMVIHLGGIHIGTLSGTDDAAANAFASKVADLAAHRLRMAMATGF